MTVSSNSHSEVCDHRANPVQSSARLRVSLAASGGGHIRQLLDLERVWSNHEAFFVSDDTPLARSIRERHPTHFVPHFAFGRLWHGAPIQVLAAALRNCFRAARIAARERPDVVITTGAGTVFFFVMWARLFGAKIVLMETFARFQAPSLFGRLTAPLASVKIVQSSEISGRWPDAIVIDPLEVTAGVTRAKSPIVLVTVGATLPFDRLVSMVAKLKSSGQIPEQVVIQTGDSGLHPPGIETYDSLTFDQIQDELRRADIVVCHAGTGSLITALREGCRVIAVPRQAALKEVYDDHQIEIAESFAVRGLIEIANDAEELAAALAKARQKPRVVATTNYAPLIGYLNDRLQAWGSRDRSSRPAPQVSKQANSA